MIIKNDEFCIALFRFNDRIAWTSEFNGSDYGGFIIQKPDLPREDVESDYRVVLQFALESLLTVKNAGKSFETWSDKNIELFASFKEKLDKKLNSYKTL